MLTVAGIGPGAREYLTFQAHNAISEAQILVGGARQLALFLSSAVKRTCWIATSTP